MGRAAAGLRQETGKKLEGRMNNGSPPREKVFLAAILRPGDFGRGGEEDTKGQGVALKHSTFIKTGGCKKKWDVREKA